MLGILKIDFCIFVVIFEGMLFDMLVVKVFVKIVEVIVRLVELFIVWMKFWVEIMIVWFCFGEWVWVVMRVVLFGWVG